MKAASVAYLVAWGAHALVGIVALYAWAFAGLHILPEDAEVLVFAVAATGATVVPIPVMVLAGKW